MHVAHRPHDRELDGLVRRRRQHIIGTNDDDTEPGSPSEFCVKGNQLKLKINNDDATSTQTQVLVFQK